MRTAGGQGTAHLVHSATAAGRKNEKNFVCIDFVLTFAVEITTRDGAEVARQAHNLEVVGSNPAPATKNDAFLN